MTAPAPGITPFYYEMRPQWYLRQMAQQFGSVYRDRKASGQESFFEKRNAQHTNPYQA